MGFVGTLFIISSGDILYNGYIFREFHFPVYSWMLSNGNKQHTQTIQYMSGLNKHGEIFVFTI